MKASVMQTNLTGGVWTPLLEGRIDIDKYKNALHLGTNGFVLPHGGFDAAEAEGFHRQLGAGGGLGRRGGLSGLGGHIVPFFDL